MADPTMRPHARVIIAEVRSGQGRFNDALEILLETRREAAQNEVRVEYLELEIGDVYANLQQWDEAVRALLKEAELFPLNLQAYANLAVLYVFSGQFDKVDPILERMVRVSPSQFAYLTAARTLRTLGDEPGAEEWERRARTVQ